MHLRPLPVSRAAHGSLGVAAILVARGLVVDPPWPILSEVLALVLAGTGALVLVRCWRLAVVCGAAGVTVRGLLWSRTVPREAVDEVTDAPALRWRTTDGRRRWTWICFLDSSGRGLPSIRRHNAAQVDHLRRWLAD